MKTKLILAIAFTVASFIASGQRPTLELTFSAVNNTSYVQLETITVINETQGGEIVLNYPDTSLVLEYTQGIINASLAASQMRVFQNYPNPVSGQTTVSLFIPAEDQVNIRIMDVAGRMVCDESRSLGKGSHSFLFTPGASGLYIFTAEWRGQTGSIKILSKEGDIHKAISLVYQGEQLSSPPLKLAGADRDFIFNLGDVLLLIGTTGDDESGILDSPVENQAYVFQFATNIPCPETPIIEYGGQVYNTIQIFSQCWLKENLNVGTMIPGGQAMIDNGIMEKYCFQNKEDSCTKYGGLYLWDEVMQYTTQQGTQGLCPPGWHLPTDADWKVLEGAVDSQYGIGDGTWNNLGINGYDAGTNLKSTTGWNNGNGADLFGFTGLPAGNRTNLGNFYNNGDLTEFWTSIEYSGNMSWGRELSNIPQSYRYYYNKQLGLSVRCLRDN